MSTTISPSKSPVTPKQLKHPKPIHTRTPDKRSVWLLNEVTDDFLLHDEFASTIASISQGKYKDKYPSPTNQMKYPAFKPSFWDDTKYNPAMAHGHICYGESAQILEITKHWQKSGKKFSDEPRSSKVGLEHPGM